VVSLGVPTVVRSSIIVREAIESLGVALTAEEQKILSQDPYYLMPKESDLLLKSAALLLSSAIRRACDFFGQSF